jgi:hypothetical protein
MVHRCASFRQKTDYYGFFRPSRSTTKVVTSPFTIIRVGVQRSGVVVQRYQAQNRNVETEAQPEKRAILSEKHQLLSAHVALDNNQLYGRGLGREQ